MAKLSPSSWFVHFKNCEGLPARFLPSLSNQVTGHLIMLSSLPTLYKIATSPPQTPTPLPALTTTRHSKYRCICLIFSFFPPERPARSGKDWVLFSAAALALGRCIINICGVDKQMIGKGLTKWVLEANAITGQEKSSLRSPLRRAEAQMAHMEEEETEKHEEIVKGRTGGLSQGTRWLCPSRLPGTRELLPLTYEVVGGQMRRHPSGPLSLVRGQMPTLLACTCCRKRQISPQESKFESLHYSDNSLIEKHSSNQYSRAKNIFGPNILQRNVAAACFSHRETSGMFSHNTLPLTECTVGAPRFLLGRLSGKMCLFHS